MAVWLAPTVPVVVAINKCDKKGVDVVSSQQGSDWLILVLAFSPPSRHGSSVNYFSTVFSWRSLGVMFRWWRYQL